MRYAAGIPYIAAPARKKKRKAKDAQWSSLKYMICIIALANQNSEMKINKLFPKGVLSNSLVCASEM